MSAIRPNLPSVLFPPQPAGQAPVRAARSDFFRVALDAVQAGGTEPSLPTAAAASPATARATAQDERPTRAGALLDIRV